MDIELLSKMIGELVLDHTEVGLPGLGTFVSEFVPASFSDRGYTINPPYKRVTFVPGRSDDDSLVKLYAGSNGVDEDQAKAILQHFLEGIKKVLMDRKTVVFPGLGRLRATRQNNFFFVTDESLDIYPEGFGLQPVSLKNHEESPSEVHHVVESLADILVEPADAEPVSETAEGAEAEGGPTKEDAETAVEETPAAAPEPPAAAEETPASASAAPAPAVEKKREYVQPETALKRREYAAPRTKSRRRVSKWAWLAPLLVIGVAALALGTFVVLAHVAPDFIDSILYTEEELRIINY